MTDEISQREAELLEAMSVEVEKQDYTARAGTPLPQGTSPATVNDVIEAIRQVYDPEIPVNVYDMGLIYGIDVKENGDVLIDMTLTAPGCPVAGILPQQVADAVSLLNDTGQVEVKIVWEPQWSIEKMTDEGRAMVDLF